MAGRAGYNLMVQLKEAYDPNNVLNKDLMFHLTKYRQMGRLQKLQKENKQVNFLLNKFGMGS